VAKEKKTTNRKTVGILMVTKRSAQDFKDLYFGTWFVFVDDETKHKYIKISDRRYVTAFEYEPRLKHGKSPRKSVIRQIISGNRKVNIITKGWE
jgi:hypothetical protein